MKKGKKGSIASIIDPMLLAGKKTAKEIVAEIIRQRPEFKDKDLAASVRARLILYRKKGYTVERTEDKILKLTKK